MAITEEQKKVINTAQRNEKILFFVYRAFYIMFLLSVSYNLLGSDLFFTEWYWNVQIIIFVIIFMLTVLIVAFEQKKKSVTSLFKKYSIKHPLWWIPYAFFWAYFGTIVYMHQYPVLYWIFTISYFVGIEWYIYKKNISYSRLLSKVKQL